MQNNYKKSYNKSFRNSPNEQIPLTKEEMFEKMIALFLKDSREKLNDLKKSKNKKCPDVTYKKGNGG